MFEEDKEIHLCYTCDAEFSVETLTDEDPATYCPFCGSQLDSEEEDLEDED